MQLRQGIDPGRFQGEFMNGLKYLVVAAKAAILVAAGTPRAMAQISVNLGVAPSAPMGTTTTLLNQCVPTGYDGPESVPGCTFIGVGPWFHGREEFRGHVNNNFDVQRGYSGRVPNNGERQRGGGRAPRGFKGNEVRDGRGHGDADMKMAAARTTGTKR